MGNSGSKTPLIIASEAASKAASEAAHRILELYKILQNKFDAKTVTKDDIDEVKNQATIATRALSDAVTAADKVNNMVSTIINNMQVKQVNDVVTEINRVWNNMNDLNTLINELVPKKENETAYTIYKKPMMMSMTIHENVHDISEKWKTVGQPVPKKVILDKVANAITMAEAAVTAIRDAIAEIRVAATTNAASAANKKGVASTAISVASAAVNEASDATDMAVNAIMKADDTVQARIKKDKIDVMVTNAQTEIKKAKTAMQTILNSNNKNYGANFKTANNAFGAMSIVHRSWENIYEKINAIKGGRRRRTHRKCKQRTHRKHRR
jgi:hypothetical protein